MEIKILEVFEQGNTLRVIVEHEYGKDNIGLSLDASYKNPRTGNFRWEDEVKELMEKKYGGRLASGKVPQKKVFKDKIGKKIKLGL